MPSNPERTQALNDAAKAMCPFCRGEDVDVDPVPRPYSSEIFWHFVLSEPDRIAHICEGTDIREL